MKNILSLFENDFTNGRVLVSSIVLSIVTVLSLLIYWYFTNTFNHWRDKGVFFLKPEIVFGNIRNRILLRQSNHEFNEELYNKLGGHAYGGFFEGRRPGLMLRDPELIKTILVKDADHFTDRYVMDSPQVPHIQNMFVMLKGSRWRALRAFFSPAFSTGRMRGMEGLVGKCCRSLVAFLRERIKDGECKEVDMNDLFGRLTLEVTAAFAFGMKGNCFKDSTSKMVKIAATIFQPSPANRKFLLFVFLLIPPRFQRFFPVHFFNNDAVSFFADIIRESFGRRASKATESRDDFIQLMLNAAKKEQEDSSGTNTKKLLDDDTVVAQTLLFLIAGFETSSSLLSFACYELAVNADVQEKLYEEIVTVLSKHDECSYEAVQQMTYLEMVLLETLRKHPPLARLDRVCTREYVLPGTSMVIEKGGLIAVSVTGLHYDAEHFPDPKRFRPDRFTLEEKNKRSPNVFLPFGLGPRNCIGRRFAMINAKWAVVHLLKHFRLTLGANDDSGAGAPYKKAMNALLLQADGGIRLNIERRSKDHEDKTMA